MPPQITQRPQRESTRVFKTELAHKWASRAPHRIQRKYLKRWHLVISWPESALILILILISPWPGSGFHLHPAIITLPSPPSHTYGRPHPAGVHGTRPGSGFQTGNNNNKKRESRELKNLIAGLLLTGGALLRPWRKDYRHTQAWKVAAFIRLHSQLFKYLRWVI